jgi:hypothetical protein
MHERIERRIKTDITAKNGPIDPEDCQTLVFCTASGFVKVPPAGCCCAVGSDDDVVAIAVLEEEVTSL